MNTNSAAKPRKGFQYECQTPHAQREYARKRFEAAPDKIRAIRRASYRRNRETIRLRMAARYLANPEPAKRRAKEYYDTHPERVKATRNAYKSARRKELTEKQKVYYYANHETELAKHALRRENHREEQRAFARMKSATLSDQYVREQLAKYSPLSMKDFPQELVEAKRLQIQLKRITHGRKAA